MKKHGGRLPQTVALASFKKRVLVINDSSIWNLNSRFFS